MRIGLQGGILMHEFDFLLVLYCIGLTMTPKRTVFEPGHVGQIETYGVRTATLVAGRTIGLNRQAGLCTGWSNKNETRPTSFRHTACCNNSRQMDFTEMFPEFTRIRIRLQFSLYAVVKYSCKLAQ